MAADEPLPARSSGLPLRFEAARYVRHDRFGIPLDHPFALQFYVNNLLVAQSRGGVLRAAMARAMVHLDCAGLALGLRRSGGIDLRVVKLCSLLRDAQVIGNKAPSVITLDDHEHSNRAKMVMFLLKPGAREPFAVVKASTRAEHGEALMREYATTCMLRQRLSEPLRAALPMPLAAVTQSGETFVAEASMSGASMYFTMRNSLLPQRCAEEHFSRSLGWLISFQKETQTGEATLGDGTVADFVIEPLRAFERFCLPGASERRLIAALERKAEALKDERVPICASHGDFWAGNLIVSREGVGVCDWEGFIEHSFPFHDLLMFITSYGLNFPWRLGRYAESHLAFNATFSGEGWMAQLVRRHLTRYCAAIGVTPKLLEVFLPVFLAMRAVEENAASRSVIEGQEAEASPQSRLGPYAKMPMWRALFQEYAHMASTGNGLRLPNNATEQS